MVLSANQSFSARGEFQLRSGQCPKCGTPFDDGAKPRRGDERWCPKCGTYRVGKLKTAGTLKDKRR